MYMHMYVYIHMHIYINLAVCLLNLFLETALRLSTSYTPYKGDAIQLKYIFCRFEYLAA